MEERSARPLDLAIPVLASALALGIWWLSDQAGSIGPLDRGQVGWILVVPTWLLAPVLGGASWTRLGSGAARGTALVFGAIVGVVAAILLWRATSLGASCVYGPTRTPDAWVVPAIVVGAVVGAGAAWTALMTRRAFRRSRSLTALATAIGASLLAGILSFVAYVVVFSGPLCNRPPGS